MNNSDKNEANEREKARRRTTSTAQLQQNEQQRSRNRSRQTPRSMSYSSMRRLIERGNYNPSKSTSCSHLERLVWTC